MFWSIRGVFWGFQWSFERIFKSFPIMERGENLTWAREVFNNLITIYRKFAHFLPSRIIAQSPLKGPNPQNGLICFQYPVKLAFSLHISFSPILFPLYSQICEKKIQKKSFILAEILKYLNSILNGLKNTKKITWIIFLWAYCN